MTISNEATATTLCREEALDGEEDVTGQLPEYIERRVDKLKDLHEERERNLKEYLKERAELESKYQALFQPLYEKRKDIIMGKMDEDIAKESGDSYMDAGEPVIKGIPNFWVLTLAHVDVIAEILTEHDIECCEHLENVTCVDKDNGEGFTLNFFFSENEYFENSVLTKTYDVPNLLSDDEPILKHVEGCNIKWREGKSLTYREKSQKQRGKGKNAGHVRTIVKQEKQESFFHFFTPPKLPSLASMNEEEAERLENEFEKDYEVAQVLRTSLVPNAVLWYEGRGMEREMEAAIDELEMTDSKE